MRIDLFKSLEGASYYGNVPEALSMPESQVDSKHYSFDVPPSELSEFAMQIDNACGAIVDAFDVDYLNASQCEQLVEFLDSYECRDNEPMSKFVADLQTAASRAAKLGTGIVIEL